MLTTKDFGLASLLISNHITMTDYRTDDLNQMWFSFNDTDVARAIERDYLTATATVNVQAFQAAQKMLKSLIYENRRKIYEHKLGSYNYNTIR